MSKAFLSHSSIDKGYVKQVFDKLGRGLAEYDACTFEHGMLNVGAIEAALARCSLFVLFVSRHSLKSAFVNHEAQLALERLGGGTLKRVLIFCLDRESFEEIHRRLKEFNIVTEPRPAAAAARKIRGDLHALNEDAPGSVPNLSFGHEEAYAAIVARLGVATTRTPKVVAISGPEGVGRLALVQKVLRNAFPRITRDLPALSLEAQDGIDDLYRRLVRLLDTSTKIDLINDYAAFQEMSYEDKLERCKDRIIEFGKNEEVLVIYDTGGLHTEMGDYQSYLRDIFAKLPAQDIPHVVLIQSRVTPVGIREKYSWLYHRSIVPLNDDEMQVVVSLRLKDLRIPFSEDELARLVHLLDGHPVNLRMALAYIQAHGIQSFLRSPEELIIWKRGRATDVLRKISFNDTERRVIGALLEYSTVPLEMLSRLCGEEPEVMKATRALEDRFVVLRREDIFEISRFLRGGAERDDRFELDENQRRDMANQIVEHFGEYRDEDNIPVALLDMRLTVGTFEKPSNRNSDDLKELLLPSHWIRLGRRAYDAHHFRESIKYCETALSLSPVLLTDGARIEALRLVGLSAARLGGGRLPNEQLSSSIRRLRQIKGKGAARIIPFLEGFNARLAGLWDVAEDRFRVALSIDLVNFSVLRELSHIMLLKEDYPEALKFAEEAYSYAPTNPYIIDILLDALIGARPNLDPDRINSLMRDLKEYGSSDGYVFHQIKSSKFMLKNRDYAEALRLAEEAISKAPKLAAAHFARAEANLRLARFGQVESDIKTLSNLVSDSNSIEARTHVMSLRLLRFRLSVENGQIDNAITALQSHSWPKSMLSRERANLARLIAFEPSKYSPNAVNWAKSASSSS